MDIKIKAVKLPRELIQTISNNHRVIRSLEQVQDLAIDILPDELTKGFKSVNNSLEILSKRIDSLTYLPSVSVPQQVHQTLDSVCVVQCEASNIDPV